MPHPLTLATMLQRNRFLLGRKEIVRRDFSGIHRYTYVEYNPGGGGGSGDRN